MLPPPSHAISTPSLTVTSSPLFLLFLPLSPTFPPPHLLFCCNFPATSPPFFYFFYFIVSLSHFPPFLLSTTPFPRPSSSSLFLFSVFSVLSCPKPATILRHGHGPSLSASRHPPPKSRTTHLRAVRPPFLPNQKPPPPRPTFSECLHDILDVTVHSPRHHHRTHVVGTPNPLISA